MALVQPPANLTDGLPEGINVVGDLEVRQDFLYLPGEVMWCKAHSVDVVGAAEQFFRRSLQDLQSGPETVIWMGRAKSRRQREGDIPDIA